MPYSDRHELNTRKFVDSISVSRIFQAIQPILVEFLFLPPVWGLGIIFESPVEVVALATVE